MDEVEKKKKDPEVYAKVVEVPTEWGAAIELKDGTRVDVTALIVEIYNDLKYLRKVLG